MGNRNTWCLFCMYINLSLSIPPSDKGEADQTNAFSQKLTFSHPSIYSLFPFISPHLLIDSLEAGWGFHGNCFHSPSASKARLLLNSQPAFFFLPFHNPSSSFLLSSSVCVLHTFCKWRLQVRRQVHCTLRHKGSF